MQLQTFSIYVSSEMIADIWTYFDKQFYLRKQKQQLF